MLCLMECFTAKKYLVDLLYRPNLKSVMSLNHQSNSLKHKYCIINCYKGKSDFHGMSVIRIPLEIQNFAQNIKNMDGWNISTNCWWGMKVYIVLKYAITFFRR